MLKAEKTIRDTVRDHKLIERGDHVVVGLSGGPDSVCLFHVLLKLAEELDLTIHPVHVNHGLRPGAADADQSFVEEMCARAGLAAEVFRVDCRALADRLGMTSEEAGRKARYDAFCQVAASAAGGGAQVKIAVAHNANDQAETVLFRILRGTGVDGIAGMAYLREETRAGGTFRIVRPLLDVWRDEVEEYCAAQKLAPVTDHTNHEELYTRNRIRLDLIPYIEKNYNSNIQETLVRMAKIAAADKEYLREETARCYARLRCGEPSEPAGCVTLDWRGLADCHEALRHRVIQKAFGEVGLDRDITAERLEAADRIILGNTGGKTVEFPHGHSLSAGKAKVRFR